VYSLLRYFTRRFLGTESPWTMLMISVGASVAAGLLIFLMTGGFADSSADLDFAGRIERLAEAEETLGELSLFVAEQRSVLEDSQARIETLREEQARLEPLLQADRELVESLVSAQEAAQRSSAWTDRWVGFAFGVIASFLGTAIWQGLRSALANRLA